MSFCRLASVAIFPKRAGISLPGSYQSTCYPRHYFSVPKVTSTDQNMLVGRPLLIPEVHFHAPIGALVNQGIIFLCPK